MYTSVIKTNRRNAHKTALIYLLASIICAVFGAVYEIFSHGVYSFYMIYAFAFPLVCGTLPFLLLSLAGIGKIFRKKPSGNPADVIQADSGLAADARTRARRILADGYPNAAARNVYHCGIITLTTGSILNGVLEIYGTTNQLLGIYWFLGSALLLASILIYLFSRFFGKKRSKMEAAQ